MSVVELVYNEPQTNTDILLNRVIKNYENRGYELANIQQLKSGDFLLTFYKEE